jgi:hypothetical protein
VVGNSESGTGEAIGGRRSALKAALCGNIGSYLNR